MPTFFQEGHGDAYQSARYGQFRVDEKGELLLAAMFDKSLNRLELGEYEAPRRLSGSCTRRA